MESIREIIMKKSLFGLCALVFGLCAAGTANAATPWYQQATICKPNPTQCYSSMSGAGYDSGMWDSDSNCWGMKYVCSAALSGARESILKSKASITAGTGINQDFDITVLGLAGDCFGARKTAANGSMAQVNGVFAKVWCSGVLENPDDFVATGEIKTSAPVPNCASLARDGWVAVLRTNSCYGKSYPTGQYFIECSGTNELPDRIIAFNGASDYRTGLTGTAPSGTVASQADANTIFDQMQANAATQRGIYFN
jgi:hypothetical protein